MIKKFARLSPAKVLLLSVLVSLTVTLSGDIKDYMAEKSARKSGQLVEMCISDNDFKFESMRSRWPEAGWKVTDGDPQLLLEKTMVFTGVEFYMSYSVYPGEMILYYTTPDSPHYSNANMATLYRIVDRPGWFGAYISATEVTSIRIDPTVMAGNHLVFGDFVINPHKTLADYIAVDGYTVLSVAVYSLALFAIFSFVQDFFTKEDK